ncbi:quinone-dependent dihydroorotate dehydrogenase [Rhodobacteraceae bacterium NNCM2]|nr:quinone-dependent dihydroorotate dehydrogenase [Coraliihabitans acroporae]
MRLGERLALTALHCLDPEKAHDLALRALSSGLAGGSGPVTSPRLSCRVFGLDFPNPVGTAAGFDKNGVAIPQTLKTGFGFAEVGAVTPRPQPGNAKPRLFRLSEDRAVINRFGFNNNGVEALLPRLAASAGSGVRGVNLGANKDSEDRAADYVAGLTTLYAHADFFTVNVSSPNTEKLRDLQGREALLSLLSRVIAARDEIVAAGGAVRRPVLVKIAPDLSEAEIADIAAVAAETGVDGIVATNTTLGREGLRSAHAGEAGGLSGAPLRDKALGVLRRLRAETGGAVPLVGVGGIGSAEDAYARIRAGASLVQLYSALVYEGVSLGGRIAGGLDRLLARDGFASVAEAVGVDQAG